MKKRFTEPQITFVLRQVSSGILIREITQAIGVSDLILYRRKKLYTKLELSVIHRLKQLEEDNRRLKQLVAELTLDKPMLQKVLLKAL